MWFGSLLGFGMAVLAAAIAAPEIPARCCREPLG